MRRLTAAVAVVALVAAGFGAAVLISSPQVGVAQESPTPDDDSTPAEIQLPPWVEDTLAELAQQGIITSEQATDVADALRENAPVRHRHGFRHFGGRHLETVAEVLGMTIEELREALADGGSIADVAGDQTQAVIDALVAEAEARIDEAVADERISAERAAEAKAELAERIDDFVNGELERPGRFGPGHHHRPGRGFFGPGPDLPEPEGTAA